jgi:hypothetical protein
VNELHRLSRERDELTRRIDASRVEDRNAFEDALDGLYEAVLAYAAQHQLPVDESSRRIDMPNFAGYNVNRLSFAGIGVELGHDDGEHRRYVRVIAEQLGCSAEFDEAPPPPQALLGLIDGLRASIPTTPRRGLGD